MDTLLEQNLQVIDTTIENLPHRLDDVDEIVEPDYQIINEIELHREGASPLFALLGVEQINALQTLEGELRRNTAVVVEPDLRRLKHLLSNRDLSGLLKGKNVVFVVGEGVSELAGELEQYFSMALIDEIKSLSPVPERTDEFSTAVEELEQFRKYAKINMDTIGEFLTDWYCYFPQNLPEYFNGPDLSNLDGYCAGDTLTIVGPGPSIDEFTQQLEELSSGWLIALDTALPILNYLDVTPDIVVSLDVGESTMDYLDPFPETAILFAPSYMNPRALDLAERAVLFDSLFPPNQWLEPQVSTTGHLAISGSVATAAMDLARGLKPAECYLLGLDLAVPGLRSYSKYSSKYQNMLRSLNRFSTLPGQFYEELKDRDLVTARLPHGNILTTDQYLTWKENLEEFIRETEVPFFQLGNEVLPLEGARRTKRVSKFHPRSSGSIPVDKRNRVRDPGALSNRAEDLLNRIREIQSELNTLGAWKEREDSIVNGWLNLVSQFGSNEEFLRYFQWEIDRVTNELQDIDPDDTDRLEKLANRQFSRWDRLLTETRKGIKTLT